MSATMRQGLASLLIRRTDEGRAKARHSIEAWKKAIEAVRQAESMAEHKINLPNEQVQGVQQAAAQVRTANYVLAVYLGNKAATHRNSVIATATGALQKEIEHRQQFKTKARQELITAINERDNAITRAKEAPPLWIGVQHVYDEFDTEPYRMSLRNAIREVATASVLGLILGIAAVSVFPDVVDTNPKDGIVDLFIWMFVYFGWLILPALKVSLGESSTRKAIRRARLKASIRDFEAKKTKAFDKAVEAAEKRLRELRPVIEERISQAEAHRKKAEGALRWLEAQAQTTI